MKNNFKIGDTIKYNNGAHKYTFTVNHISDYHLYSTSYNTPSFNKKYCKKLEVKKEDNPNEGYKWVDWCGCYDCAGHNDDCGDSDECVTSKRVYENLTHNNEDEQEDPNIQEYGFYGTCDGE